MNKNNRISLSFLLFIVGALLLGWGFAGIDFAFGDDRWSRTDDRTSDFPLLGKMPTRTAFTLGTITVAGGLLMIFLGAYIAVINYSTVRTITLFAAGAISLGWGIWGIAFAFNTAEYRITHGIDEVGIPCHLDTADVSSQCTFTSQDWLNINILAIGVGIGLMIVSIKKSRFYTIHEQGAY